MGSDSGCLAFFRALCYVCPMAKIILLAVIFFVAYSLAKDRSPKSSAPKAPKTEDMVKCAHCGIHLPRSESIASGNLSFCCEEHRRLYTK